MLIALKIAVKVFAVFLALLAVVVVYTVAAGMLGQGEQNLGSWALMFLAAPAASVGEWISQRSGVDVTSFGWFFDVIGVLAFYFAICVAIGLFVAWLKKLQKNIQT